MELPANVMIFNSMYENVNNKPARLIAVHPEGFYELRMKFRDKHHMVLVPVNGTVLIYQEAVLEVETDFEIER